MNKTFSFKGVVRGNDNIFANDGECLELVNLRMVNGSLKPIPAPITEAHIPVIYSDIYLHDKASCYVCIRKDDERGVDFYDLQWNLLLDNQGMKLHFPLLKGVRMVEFMGYVVSCMTDNGIRYLIFSGGTYRWLGESPIVPSLLITPSPVLHEVNTEVTFTTNLIDTHISSLWQYNARGYFDECISKANKAGCYIDRALFRFALRLYDGSYIYTSHPIYVSNYKEVDGVARDDKNLVAIKNSDTSSDSTYKVKVLGFKPQFKFENLKMDDWDGVIVGIDIFTTGSIMGKRVEESVVSVLDTSTKQHTTEKIELYKKKELDEIISEISDASLYYKVAEYNIWGKCLNSIDDVSQANIVLQDALSGFEQRHTLSSIVPECSYMFNNRLHLASLREYLFKGYGSESLLPAGVAKAMVDMVIVRTRIETQSGVSTVMNRFENLYLGYDNGTFLLPAMLSYPDSRAYEMTIFIYYDTEFFGKRFPLTPHKFLNMSQYIHKSSFGYEVSVTPLFANAAISASIAPETAVELFGEQEGTYEVIYFSTLHSWTYNGEAFPPKEYSTLRIFAIPRNVVNGDKLVFTISKSTAGTNNWDIDNIPFDSDWEVYGGIDDCGEEENIYETKENVLKVSLVENPFIFPARCTYPLSRGAIIALSTNRATMSEGQFGEHPLYIFSQGGIDVMAVDASGKTAYSNIYPVSHEVCCNSEMVCGTDSGVLFLSQQGVMLISGNRCVRLSTALDNENSEPALLSRTGVIGRIASSVGLAYVLDSGTFTRFMSSAKVARYATMNELMFCNPNYDYCYIYSLDSNMWSKTDRRIDGFVKKSGALTMFCDSGVGTEIFLPGNIHDSANSVFLVTRPHHFGTKLPKRIIQLMLHASLAKPQGYNPSSAFVSCYLLCSNDGVNFKLVTGSERKESRQDIVFPYFPTQSYRYFIFALAGNLDVMSMISALEIDVDVSWGKKRCLV